MPPGSARPTASRTAVVMLMLVVAAAVVRLVVLPVNEHLYGDAVARTEMAERWARTPHLITSFADGAAQFGPLHLYLIAAALEVVNRNDASRIVSFVFGVLTVVPLYAVTRRYFDGRAAVWACLGFALWGLHIQTSTTGGSEAVALCLMWTAFAAFARGLDDRRILSFLAAAVALNLAGATRYDAWMYVPLMALVPPLAWTDDRAAGLRLGLVFLVACLPFPVFWMIGNQAALGDALYPLTFIDAFHRTWAESAGPGWPRWWLRAQGIGFWPAMAFVTLTPGVAALGITGMVIAWRRHPATRWLSLAALVPVLYYAARTTILFDFVPLGRFTVVQLSLLLPFVLTGFRWYEARCGALRARRLAIATVVLAVVVPVGLGLFTLRSSSTAATVLRPISPVSRNPPALMDAADYIRTEIVDRGATLAIDSDATYLDLQVGFFARLTDAAAARMRWPGFRERVEQAPPAFVVLFDNGLLAHEPWVVLEGHTLVLAGSTYREVAGIAAPVRIFAR